MDYLKYVMDSMSNMIHNASQSPSAETCNQMLDSMKRICKEYEEMTWKKLNVVDYRERR